MAHSLKLSLTISVSWLYGDMSTALCLCIDCQLSSNPSGGARRRGALAPRTSSDIKLTKNQHLKCQTK